MEIFTRIDLNGIFCIKHEVDCLIRIPAKYRFQEKSDQNFVCSYRFLFRTSQFSASAFFFSLFLLSSTWINIYYGHEIHCKTYNLHINHKLHMPHMFITMLLSYAFKERFINNFFLSNDVNILAKHFIYFTYIYSRYKNQKYIAMYE